MAQERLDWLKKSAKENQIACGVATVLFGGYAGFRLGKYYQGRKKQAAIKKFEEQSNEENKVILHMSPRWDFSTPHPSPYVTKMMAYLAYHKIDYIVDTTMSQHFYTNKMPWITYKNEHQP